MTHTNQNLNAETQISADDLELALSELESVTGGMIKSVRTMLSRGTNCTRSVCDSDGTTDADC
jgi:isopentenyl phosphate kinase